MKKITPESVVNVSRLTAKGGIGANNLCQATLDAGVNTVIGFSMSIPMTGDRYWMKKFTEHLTDKWGQTAYSYINISDLAMDDVRDWNSDIMEYDYFDPDNNVIHVKMDSCVVFGQQSIPTANAWN